MSEILTASPAAPARLPLRHLLSAEDLDRSLIETLLGSACAMERLVTESGAGPLRGQILATLFYEPSTRTRLSFEAAMLRLGGQVVSVADALAGSSAAKGESLEDSIRVVGGYTDLIALRHPEVGAAARAARVSPVPIINAGDGAGQHPTQALLDLYTIQRELGRLDHLRVGLAGDLKHGRTVRSLCLLLSRFEGHDLIFIPAPGLQLGEDILAVLRQRGVSFETAADIYAAAPTLDVLYQTRVQRERLAGDAEGQAVPGGGRVDRGVMERLPRHAIVMHPLPRVDEIDPAVDGDPRAAYFRQAGNGLFVRMAVLYGLAARG